jgi:hypothetical protein
MQQDQLPTAQKHAIPATIYHLRHRLLWVFFYSTCFACGLFGALFALGGVIGVVQGMIPLWGIALPRRSLIPICILTLNVGK